MQFRGKGNKWQHIFFAGSDTMSVPSIERLDGKELAEEDRSCLDREALC
jgi:hypothetical protein